MQVSSLKLNNQCNNAVLKNCKSNKNITFENNNKNEKALDVLGNYNKSIISFKGSSAGLPDVYGNCDAITEESYLSNKYATTRPKPPVLNISGSPYPRPSYQNSPAAGLPLDYYSSTAQQIAQIEQPSSVYVLDKATSFGLDLDSYKPNVSRNNYRHNEFTFNSPVLNTNYGNYPKPTYLDKFWVKPNANQKSNDIYGWKLNIYADSEKDWQKLVDTVGQYLNDAGIHWLTFGDIGSTEELQGDEMQGNAFSIYPSFKEEFAQLAHDIDYIIKNNNMTSEDASIRGDRQLGNSGRLFYSYMCNSGEHKDMVFDMSNPVQNQKFQESLKTNEDDSFDYLASDMTIQDDPWRSFVPARYLADYSSSSKSAFLNTRPKPPVLNISGSPYPRPSYQNSPAAGLPLDYYSSVNQQIKQPQTISRPVLNKATSFGLDLDSYMPNISQKGYSRLEFTTRNPILNKEYHYGFRSNDLNDFWVYNDKHTKTQEKCSWKLHVYADNEKDWQKLVDTVGQYLNDVGVRWKTLADASVAELNSDYNQKGKAFTIYPSSKEQFAQLAHDIDYIVKNNDLETSTSNIIGDRQLGDSGRLFYRYEYKSKAHEDLIFDISYQDQYDKYMECYDFNRGQGPLSYLASDMTIQDDPWRNFIPANY